MATSTYIELLLRIDQGYKNASNAFHPADAAKKIFEAIGGFALPFQKLADVIDRQRTGLYSKPEQYATDWTNALRVIEAQLGVLESAIHGAARADRAKAAGTIVDQRSATKKAQQHQSADAELVKKIKQLISQARSDAVAAGKMQPGGDASRGDDLGPIDVDEFKRSLEEHAAPKEDGLLAKQLALIGGQAART
jgi:hypothetical protein